LKQLVPKTESVINRYLIASSTCRIRLMIFRIQSAEALTSPPTKLRPRFAASDTSNILFILPRISPKSTHFNLKLIFFLELIDPSPHFNSNPFKFTPRGALQLAQSWSFPEKNVQKIFTRRRFKYFQANLEPEVIQNFRFLIPPTSHTKSPT
jgi:hypothetical protein